VEFHHRQNSAPKERSLQRRGDTQNRSEQSPGNHVNQNEGTGEVCGTEVRSQEGTLLRKRKQLRRENGSWRLSAKVNKASDGERLSRKQIASQNWICPLQN
jgi:hypothetical protein